MCLVHPYFNIFIGEINFDNSAVSLKSRQTKIKDMPLKKIKSRISRLGKRLRNETELQYKRILLTNCIITRITDFTVIRSSYTNIDYLLSIHRDKSVSSGKGKNHKHKKK